MADISSMTLLDGSYYNIKDKISRESIRFGRVDSTSTSTNFTATVDGITSYHDGVAVMLVNGVVASASGFTININGLGAKPVYSNMAAASADTTIFKQEYTMLFVYDETRVSGGCWICYRGYNTTAYTSNPEMDGTASAGSSTSWAKGDHVHPTDTSRQATLISGTNIKTINNTSLLGSGNIQVMDDPLSGQIVCIGDSWLQGWTPSETVTSWGRYMAQILGKTEGVDYFQGAYGGAGFMATVDNYNFLALLTHVYQDLDVDPDQVTAVIVSGGGNDRNYVVPPYQNQYTEAVQTFITTAKTYFPKARVYVGAGSIFVDCTLIEKVMIPMRLSSAATSVGGIYIGNIAAIMLAYKGYYASDNKHPGAYGQLQLAKRIINAIRGGNNGINRNVQSIEFGNGNIWNYISNDIYHLDIISRVIYTLPSSVSSLSCNGNNVLCTVDFSSNDAYYLNTADTYSKLSTTTAGSVHDQNGYHPVSFHVEFVGKTIKFCPYGINSAGNGFLNLSKADIIHFVGLQLTCDVGVM